MASIVARVVKDERESSYHRAVDHLARSDHDVIVGRSEIEIRRKPAGRAEPTLPQTGPALEDQSPVVKEAFVGKEPQQMILRDVEQRRTVRSGSSGRVAAH